MKTNALRIMAVLLITGCLRGGLNLMPGPIKLYDGPDQPTGSVAVIENDRNMYMASVDSQDLRRWTHSHDVLIIHVLPGKHVIVAQPSARAGFVSVHAARIEFVAAAGHHYVVSRRILGGTGAGEWTAVFTDTTTGKELVP